MAKLTFTYDMGYVSSAFEGGMTLQCLFDGNGKHVIFIQSRLSEELPWTVIRSIVVAPQSVFTIPEAAEGQTFRIRCESEPQSVDIAPMTAVAGGSSTTIDGIDIEKNNNGEVDSLAEVIAALKGFPEGKTVKEALEELEATNLTDEDIENIFYGTSDDDDDDEPEPTPEPSPEPEP